jgi:hypothetical protein
MTENQILYLRYFVLYFGDSEIINEEFEKITASKQTGWY